MVVPPGGVQTPGAHGAVRAAPPWKGTVLPSTLHSMPRCRVLMEDCLLFSGLIKLTRSGLRISMLVLYGTAECTALVL
jgi:hypothetical protein